MASAIDELAETATAYAAGETDIKELTQETAEYEQESGNDAKGKISDALDELTQDQYTAIATADQQSGTSGETGSTSSPATGGGFSTGSSDDHSAVSQGPTPSPVQVVLPDTLASSGTSRPTRPTGPLAGVDNTTIAIVGALAGLLLLGGMN